jgi:tetratricopeptide (TPR) repeat protein/serine/threonine protein kinase
MGLLGNKKIEGKTAKEWFDLGYNAKDPEEKIGYYTKCLEINPKDASAWHNKGIALRRLERYEEAIRCYDKALEIDPKDASAWYNKGIALGYLERYEEAIRCYDKALEIDPKDETAKTLKALAENNLRKRKEKKELSELSGKKKIEGKTAKEWFDLGYNAKDPEEKIEYYTKCLEIDPKDASAWYNKGYALYKLKRYKEEAIRCFDKALEIDPKDASAWNLKGIALHELKRYEEAIRCFDKALEIDPKHAPAWHNKGLALSKLKRYEEAIICYDKALEINPKDASAWNLKGIALHELKRYEEAIICYDKALEIDPKDETAKTLKELAEKLRELKEKEKPKITLELTKHNFRLNYWEKVDLILRNTGASPAKAINLSFSKEVEVKGLKEIDLSVGEEKRLNITLLPKNAGEIPVEVDIKYEKLDGEAYQTRSEFILSVGEVEPIEQREKESRPAEFISRPITPSTFPPELQDKYRDVEYISKGGFARVFRAKRISDGRTVAVKVPLSLDEETGRSFLKEIKAWEGLRHENIIELYDVNIMPIPYFEMEYADKGNLEGLKKPVKTEEATMIIFEILEGLKYAHDKGVIHRDLKPQNVLLTGNLIPKISDWGLSKVMSESKSSSITSFSPLYAAPEQVDPKQFGRPDPRTDNYQVGVIFYELVTGRLPFEGDSIMEISSAIVGKEPDLPSEINADPDVKDVEPIIMKCLKRRKEDRYQTAAELQRALAGYLEAQLSESLKRSSSRGNLTRSRLFCVDLVLLAAKQGDYTEMLKYLSVLKDYAKEEEKAAIENLMQGISHRQERGIQPGKELLRELEILAYQVQMK